MHGRTISLKLLNLLKFGDLYLSVAATPYFCSDSMRYLRCAQSFLPSLSPDNRLKHILNNYLDRCTRKLVDYSSLFFTPAFTTHRCWTSLKDRVPKKYYFVTRSSSALTNADLVCFFNQVPPLISLSCSLLLYSSLWHFPWLYSTPQHSKNHIAVEYYWEKN